MTASTQISNPQTQKCGRDLIKEYVEAVRAEGLKVGIYFTIIDWYHDDYPHYGDRQHPMRNNPAYKNDGRNFDNYLTYMHNQIREICTNYGKIDILWFDFSYGDMRGEKKNGKKNGLLFSMASSYSV